MGEDDHDSESEEENFWHSREERPLLRGGGARDNKDRQPAAAKEAASDAKKSPATSRSESCCCFKVGGPTKSRSTALWLVLCLNTTFTLVQIFCAYWAHSMSLATDSIHMAIDSVGYGLLVYAQSAREKEIGSGMVKKSGFASNMEKIAVGFSLFSLLAVTSFCTVEAKNRIVHPETHIELLDGTAVLVLSLVGLLFDILSVVPFCWSGFSFLHAHSHGPSSCSHGHADGDGGANMLSAFVHVVSDLMRSFLMTISGVLIVFRVTPPVETDSVCSLVVSLFVFVMVAGFSARFWKSIFGRSKEEEKEEKGIEKHRCDQDDQAGPACA